MRIGVVILARFSSSRLPGKALAIIYGKPVLTFIIERLLQVVTMDQLVLAMSNEVSDEPLASYATTLGLPVYRGSLTDVATRFYEAAKFAKWDYAARINGDNIFVDTDLLKKMLKSAFTNKYDFISNVKNRTYPKGMSIEVVRLSYYASKLALITASSQYSEHVTLFFYEHENSTHYYFYNEDVPEAAGIQLALDTPQDLERTKKIMAHFQQEHWKYNLQEVMNICKTLANEESI